MQHHFLAPTLEAFALQLAYRRQNLLRLTAEPVAGVCAHQALRVCALEALRISA